MMHWVKRNDSGQISVLVLAIALALLAGTYLVGALAQLLVAQQRLISKAESIALAGAQELEFNQSHACDVAQVFGMNNFGLMAECIIHSESIEILISEPNPSPIFEVVLPKIYASSRAGIAQNN
jgi:secretion/DNA translocation related TadE-like protein